MTIEQRVKQFIAENFYLSNPAELTDDLSLITSGFVDSTGMLEVLSFLEGEFGIRITDHETIPENLETVARIAAFVARKQQERAGEPAPQKETAA